MKNFLQAIKGRQKVSIIAEIKKSSPSHGPFLKHDTDVLLNAYNQLASAISVVTDPLRFSGSLSLISEIRPKTNLPILRKDFLTKVSEVEETSSAGANAILILAYLLESNQIAKMIEASAKNNLTPLLELHDQNDFQKLQNLLKMELPEFAVGINNRDLKTFQTDKTFALDYLKKLPQNLTIVAESAISDGADLALYKGKIDAVLIGTALLDADDPLLKLKEFCNHC